MRLAVAVAFALLASPLIVRAEDAPGAATRTQVTTTLARPDLARYYKVQSTRMLAWWGTSLVNVAMAFGAIGGGLVTQSGTYAPLSFLANILWWVLPSLPSSGVVWAIARSLGFHPDYGRLLGWSALARTPFALATAVLLQLGVGSGLPGLGYFVFALIPGALSCLVGTIVEVVVAASDDTADAQSVSPASSARISSAAFGTFPLTGGAPATDVAGHGFTLQLPLMAYSF